MSFVGEAVIAARAPGHDLLPVLGYKSLAAEAVERAVERSGGHVHGAVRKLLGALDDPVAVQRSVELGTHTFFVGEVTAAGFQRDEDTPVLRMEDTRMNYGG